MKSKTAELLDALQRSAQNNGIDRAQFRCPYYHECDASVANRLEGGKCCSLSYVGRAYAEGFCGHAFRLVLVGMDHGDPGGGNYEDRRAGIEKYYQLGGKNFDQYYSGVLKTAAAVFGQLAERCGQECTVSCQKSREPNSRNCVMDSIAQLNLVKCVPVTQADRTSRVTWKMVRNCTNHLLSELMLLKPHLVVFHGAKARWAVLPKMNDLHPVGSVGAGGQSALYECGSLNAHFLFLHHPSRHWLARQWDSVVLPALKYLRDKNAIPG